MLALLSFGAACRGGGSKTAATPAPSASASTFSIASGAFADGTAIPAQYTCSGAGTSPALRWSGAPSGTKSFALIMDDPDAPLQGGFTHWVAFDLPGSASALPANVPSGDIASGGRQGANGRGQPAYTGPCPPAGAPHHYHFRLYALDAPLGLAAGASKAAVLAALQPHILAQAEIVGLYGR
jgi:Raf kinase inhibitor-like YbhB/YbcL family protein